MDLQKPYLLQQGTVPSKRLLYPASIQPRTSTLPRHIYPASGWSAAVKYSVGRFNTHHTAQPTAQLSPVSVPQSSLPVSMSIIQPKRIKGREQEKRRKPTAYNFATFRGTCCYATINSSCFGDSYWAIRHCAHNTASFPTNRATASSSLQSRCACHANSCCLPYSYSAYTPTIPSTLVTHNIPILSEKQFFNRHKSILQYYRL